MGWREKNKPEGCFSRYTRQGHLRNTRTRWFSQYQEKRLWDREFGRSSRSAGRLRDGWLGDSQIKLQRSWKRYRKTQYRPK